MKNEQPKLLIFVIAYYAEATLKKTLERIPGSVFEDYDCEILVVDDASKDRTFEIGRAYKKAHPNQRMVVLRNTMNQGYGGNQKVGYAYAQSEGFELVAMVHGDGQYAPEELPNLLAPFSDNTVDAVFGSRMMTALGALKGNMPLYKYVGNRILTTAQNALLGSRLSEFHTGYRVYRVATLAKLPLRLDANDFHFDTEIIIQLLNARANIVERPIPTFYGDEISRVNGMKYARDVMIATLRNTAHRMGILYQRRFDTESKALRESSKLAYTSSHSLALKAVPEGARVALAGAPPRDFVAALEDKGCDVAQSGEKIDARQVDHILLIDTLSRVKSPEETLFALRQQFDYAPRTLIATVPNVAFFVQRLMLLAGQFNYAAAGVLDTEHRRLFTFRSLQRLLRDEGFKVKEVRGVPAPFPKAIGDNGLSRLMLRANEALIKVSKTLFSYQIYVEAEGSPDVAFVLADSKKSDVVSLARHKSRKARETKN